MARAFDVGARVSSFELPALTKRQIKALILDLDLDARSVVIRAVAELWQHEIGATELKTFRYDQISVQDLSATDLHSEVVSGATAYRITIYDATGTRAAPETAQALYDPNSGRMGIAWGADATWADVKDVESGIEMWLNDGEAWEAAH